MQLRLMRSHGFVSVEVSGPARLKSFVDLVRVLGKLTREQRDALLLVDLLNVDGELHTSGQAAIGDHVLEHLAHLRKVAAVMPAHTITEVGDPAGHPDSVQFQVYASRDQATAWLLEREATLPTTGSVVLMDPIRSAFWEALRSLFPPHAQAVQLANGSLAISWSVANEPQAHYGMATPITIRFEPELIEAMRIATPEQRKRIVGQQEPLFRAGLVGYDPYAAVPRARVIVLG